MVLRSGAGKSFLACALAHAAVRRGHSALYLRTPRLLAELALSRGDGRYVRRLGQLARIGLLVSASSDVFVARNVMLLVAALTISEPVTRTLTGLP